MHGHIIYNTLIVILQEMCIIKVGPDCMITHGGGNMTTGVVGIVHVCVCVGWMWRIVLILHPP